VPDGLYERDALAWAEQQAALLRRLAAGERLNEAVDWPNVIEELQDVGLSELRACRSLLAQALAHLLKLRGWPADSAAAHWRGETASFLAGARRSFTPSMSRRIDLADLYADALYEVRTGTNAGELQPLPETCPFTLDDLLAERPDVMELAAKLNGEK
jgi:hypothetical protein